MKRIALPRMLRVASFRFAALYVALFAASAFVLGVAVFLEARSALQQQMDARIEAETAFLKAEYGAGSVDRLLAVVGARGRGASALDYLVEDRDRAHLAGEMPAVESLSPGWTTIDVPQATEDGGGPERVRTLVSDLGGGLLLAVGADLGKLTDMEEAIVTAFLWTVGLAAALGIGGGALLSRAFLNRVDAIALTAEAIIGGDLARRVPVRGTGDDLDRLAGLLNRMLDRMGVLMDSLRQVGSDVAHDLRTPLSRLYQRLEDARTHARSMADYETAVDAAVTEAEGLLEIFSALLRIAQVEGSSPRAGFRDVDLSAVADDVADAYRPDAEEAGHSLTASVAPGVIVHGDQELLTQALANLVENSLRHTPAGTRIGVTLADGAGGVSLAVEDDGPGVAAADLPRLTHRFYRGERSRTTPGNGLGLSLVSAVAELHGAKLNVTSTEPGLRVSLLFPVTGQVPRPASLFPPTTSPPIRLASKRRRVIRGEHHVRRDFGARPGIPHQQGSRDLKTCGQSTLLRGATAPWPCSSIGRPPSWSSRNGLGHRSSTGSALRVDARSMHITFGVVLAASLRRRLGLRSGYVANPG